MVERKDGKTLGQKVKESIPGWGVIADGRGTFRLLGTVNISEHERDVIEEAFSEEADSAEQRLGKETALGLFSDGESIATLADAALTKLREVRVEQIKRK